METIFRAKANENIQAAEILFANDMYNASANRSYYAALHAAVAALEREGFHVERIEHDKVQAKLNTELIHRRKLVLGRFRSDLLDLQAVRDIADYASRGVSKKVAQRQLNRAREYVAALQQET